MRIGALKYVVIFLIAIAVCMTMIIPYASAGTSAEKSGTGSQIYGQDLQSRLQQVPDFKFKVHKDGIGYGTCPVYTAPSINAYRCANGQAACSTNEHIDEAGYDVSGWLLVRYETNNGAYRVGYIPPNYVQGFKSGMSFPQFDYIPVTANDYIYVTDNPLLNASYYAILDPGETFYVLGKYTYIGDWWYIECTVDNQLARGFINRETSSFVAGNVVVDNPTSLGSPSLSPIGTAQIGTVTVLYGSNGERKNVRERPDPNSEIVTRVNVEERFPCYAKREGTNGSIWYYIFIEKDSAWGWISSTVSSISY